MDAFIRGRSPLLIVALGTATALIAACARSTGPAVGQSDRRIVGRPSSGPPDAGFIDGAAALPAGYRTTFTKVNTGRFVSRGHAPGRWEVDVWANELAQKALAARAREAPVGAVLVEEHFETSGTKAPGPIMVMEKRPPGFSKEHGDWRYVVVGSQGQLVKDGVIESCAGCHDDAPADGLFPVVE